jgi:hypothetical protein
MKAKQLLDLQLEVLPPYTVVVSGQTVDSNRFPIGSGEDSPEGGRRFFSPLEYTGTKDEAEIFAMMPDMFRVLHKIARNRKLSARLNNEAPLIMKEIHSIVNDVMERCDMDIEMDHKKVVDKLAAI